MRLDLARTKDCGIVVTDNVFQPAMSVMDPPNSVMLDGDPTVAMVRMKASTVVGMQMNVLVLIKRALTLIVGIG